MLFFILSTQAYTPFPSSRSFAAPGSVLALCCCRKCDAIVISVISFNRIVSFVCWIVAKQLYKSLENIPHIWKPKGAKPGTTDGLLMLDHIKYCFCRQNMSAISLALKTETTKSSAQKMVHEHFGMRWMGVECSTVPGWPDTMRDAMKMFLCTHSHIWVLRQLPMRTPSFPQFHIIFMLDSYMEHTPAQKHTQPTRTYSTYNMGINVYESRALEIHLPPVH